MEKNLDTSGLKCPLPVLKSYKAMKDLARGDVLRVISTDPKSPKDFQDFCKTAGYKLIENGKKNGKFFFRIQRT
jgi:tRNA 2-thiouridine synthesizing protein A